jgi:hypothetical protein
MSIGSRQFKVAATQIGVLALLTLVPIGPDATREVIAQPGCPVPIRPWEFLDASSQIEFIPDTPGTNVFRATQFGDFNNDGRLDVVVSQARSSAGVTGTPYRGVLYMNENGEFVDRTAEYFPDLLTPEVRWWTAHHDFVGPNGTPDGWVDTYIGGGGGPSRFYRNLGEVGGVWQGFGDESWRIQGPSATASNSYHQHKADLDGDGLMDVVEYANGDPAGQLRAMMNRDGMFVDETDARLPLRIEPSLFGHVEDLSGDGAPDISVSNLHPTGGVPQIRVLINDGTGHFPLSLEQVVPQPATDLGLYGLDHVDVNDDGKLDIYAVNYGKGGDSTADAILLNLGTGNSLFNTVLYPQFPNGDKDGDGDHPVNADFDGDGLIDLATAQFATKTFMLRNQTCGGVPKLVEKTAPQVPTGGAFRNRSFDANGDGVPDLWIGRNQQNVGHALIIGNLQETEQNGTIAQANATTTFPALRTGTNRGAQDLDVFGLPTRAFEEGAQLKLESPVDTDLELALLDAGGAVMMTSAVPGNGSVETINISAGSAGRYLRVERQGGTQSRRWYRLSMVPTPGSEPVHKDRVPDGTVPANPATRGSGR